MNKEQLVAATARRIKVAKDEENIYSKWEIAAILPHILDTISETLADGEEVKLKDFGRFSIKTLKAHNAINPNTKERIWVPEKKKIVFHPTPHFKFNESGNLDESPETTKEKE